MSADQAGARLRLRALPLDLPLKHPFGIARGVRTRAANVLVELVAELPNAAPLTGLGEGSPNSRYGESQPASMMRLARLVAGNTAGLPLADPADLMQAEAIESLIDRIAPRLSDCRAALAALDIALWDLHGRLLNAPLHRLWQLDPARCPPTSLSIGLAPPEQMAARAARAARHGFCLLKVKLGGPHCGGAAGERDIVAAIRDAAPDARIRVDVNEGWPDAAEALARIERLAELGVELVEQPLPAAQSEQMQWLRARSPLPLFADEALAGTVGADEMAALAGGYHGVNIKVDKCGGLLAARRQIRAARAAGLQVMIGCMVASSLAITAAAHLAPLADQLDLDGHLLLAIDPFVGVTLAGGFPRLPDRPGVGAMARG